jgi:hypothetical protein
LKFGNKSVAAWMNISANKFRVRAQTIPKKMPLIVFTRGAGV